MGYVCKGNEQYNTTAIREKIQLVADKIAKVKLLNEEIAELCCNDDDLYPLGIWHSSDISSDFDPIAKYDNWLASNHNC